MDDRENTRPWPSGMVVTGLGKAAWFEGDRLVQVVSDGTTVGLQLAPTLALDLAIALLEREGERVTAAIPATGLAMDTDGEGRLVLIIEHRSGQHSRAAAAPGFGGAS